MASFTHGLKSTQSRDGRVEKLGEASWHLEIPANANCGYRLAQLDDHGNLPRGNFPWQPPLRLSLQARASTQMIPGTWGFGLWNDPFSFLLAFNRLVPRLPTLPQAAWFFHASSHNYLSFRDDLPANGFLAATFRAKKIPTLSLLLASPILVLTLLPRTAQVVRRLLCHFIQQDTSLVPTDVTQWHTYQMEWDLNQVRFSLDGTQILLSRFSPSGPLSLVIWVDNQYASLPPNGRLRYGTLPNPEPAWLEIREFSIA
jgi:hypothetical protein